MLKHIETKADYAEYQKRVSEFLSKNKVRPGCFSQVDEDSEGFFSWSPCECCRRSLGGTRETYEFAMEPEQTKTGEPDYCTFKADICTDCIYYLTYGTLDDLTMLELDEKPAN